MRVLVCNLDPEWDFIDWSWRHGVDLYLDTGVTLWDASSSQGMKPALDWPHSLKPEQISTRLKEYAVMTGAAPDLVIMLAGLAGPLDAAVVNRVAAEMSPAAKRVLLSTGTFYTAALKDMDLSAFHTVFLSAQPDNREHYYLFRLLLEMLQTGDAALLQPAGTPGDTALQLEIAWQGTGSATDHVIGEWPGRVAELLRQYQVVLQSNENVAGFERFDEEVVEYEGNALKLLDDTPPEGSGAATLNDIEAPLFYRHGLLSVIDAACRKFYSDLQMLLQNEYAALQKVHDDETENLARKGDKALAVLEELSAPVRQALNRDAVRWLENTRRKLQHELIPRVHARLDRNLATMQGENVEPPAWRQIARRHAPVLASFMMPWFREDQQVDSARTTLRNTARRLAGKAWFFGAAGVVAVLAALPAAARVLGDGAPFGWLDAAWTGLFAGLFLCAQILYSWLRRRHLRRDIHALQSAAQVAVVRHRRALRASYKYMYAREALRRLACLEQLCDRYLTSLQTDIETVSSQRAFMQLRADYFRRHGMAAKAAVTRGRWWREDNPGAWLAAVLEDYCRHASSVTPQEIQIRDRRLAGGRKLFHSHYLYGVDTLTIRPLDPAP